MAVRSPTAGPTLSEARGEERAGVGSRPREATSQGRGAAAGLALGVGGGCREAGPPLFTIPTLRPREPSDPGFRRDGRGSGEAEVPRRGCVRALKVAS